NAIIFCNRKMDVDVVAKSLKKHGYDAEPIHGDLDQSQRTRTLDGFRAGEVKILVASDVAARGLDVPAVSHVFNFDVPSHAEDYVHRIGRTGRAGRKGTAIMICNPRDEKNLEDVERLVQNPIPRLDDPKGAKAAPAEASAAEAANEEERPRRTRTRSRSRARDDAKPDAKAETRETSAPKTEAAPKPEAKPEPKAETKPEPKAEPKAEPKPEPKPASEARQTEPRGGNERGRGGRDRRRGETRDEDVVGMGEDTPAFILKSFEERRAG
ncbi:helicase-related protein, partial [Limimaricola sp.]|uniref:helicase-related protein n=1 Tax=Limimaricola sp. TaxID=2211665 RepID=UPI004059C1F9